jgi:hypothetical protein
MKLKVLAISLIAAGMFSSCKQEFLETKPTDKTSTADAFATTKNAWAAVNGMHRYMWSQIYGQQSQGGYAGNMLKVDIYGEDLVFPNTASGWLRGEYQWLSNSNPSHYANLYHWGFHYALIGNANMIIANIDNAVGEQKDKDAIKAEALTYRAFSYFQLVQLFGKRYVAGQPNSDLGVSLILTPSTTPVPRSTVAEVYAQIDADISEAIALFNSSGFKRNAKSHFDINVAQGLKARVALTKQDWATAIEAARAARAGYPLMNSADYVKGFNNYDNNEWLWGSRIITAETNYFYSFFAYMSHNFNSTVIRTNPKLIFSKLYDKISDTDVRKTLFDPTGTAWTMPATSYQRFPYMHKKFLVNDPANSVGDIPYMRAAEMYLIEAEALAAQGKDAEAAQVLYDLVITRDPGYTKSTKTGAELMDEILTQRRIELWGEGFRFYDLKRRGLKLDRTGGNHNATYTNGLMTVEPDDKRWQLAIPDEEIKRTNGVVVQNPL